MLLSGVFCDSVGRDALVIKDNEWSVSTGNWDVECVGPRITIRSGPGDIVLVLKLNPPHGIIVERINMLFEGLDSEAMIKLLKYAWMAFIGRDGAVVV